MFYATQDFMTWIQIELQNTPKNIEFTYKTGFTYHIYFKMAF